MTWYYLNESGEVAGPVSEQDLKKMTAAGTLTDASQICLEGNDAWISLTEGLGMDARGGGTEEADLDEISTEDAKASNAASEPNGHSDENQEEELKQSFADRLKSGAKEGWSDIKRTSRKAAIHAQIEKLRNVDLRKVLFALGEKCYESGILQGECQEQFQQIRDLDVTIASKQETENTVDSETKMDALKRMGKDAAKTSHAQALTVKRQHLVTELGRQVHARMAEKGQPGLEAEVASIEEVEGRIRDKEEEARILGTGHAKGWKNRIPAIAVTAVLILLLIGGSFLGLRMIGAGKEKYFVSSKPEEIIKSKEFRAFEDDFGVPLDYESATVYAMSHEIGKRANPGTTLDQLLKTARQASTGTPQFRKVMEAGIRDGLEGRPNRIEGVNLDKSYTP